MWLVLWELLSNHLCAKEIPTQRCRKSSGLRPPWMGDGDSEKHSSGRTMKQSYQEGIQRTKRKEKWIRLSQFYYSRLRSEIDV